MSDQDEDMNPGMGASEDTTPATTPAADGEEKSEDAE